MPGRRGPPTPAISGACASAAAASVPVDCPAPGCVTIPAGLSTTRTWASSKTIASGIASAAISSGAGGGTATSTLSPALSRCAALLAAPFTLTWPPSTSALMRVRDSSGSRAASHRSRRRPASAALNRGRHAPGGTTVMPAAAWPHACAAGVSAERQHAEREERHAHADGRVGDVEGGPVPPAPVEVEEVHHRPEARAIDQVARRAAEDHADGDGGDGPALGQEPRGQRREHAEGADGEQRDDPAPAAAARCRACRTPGPGSSRGSARRSRRSRSRGRRAPGGAARATSRPGRGSGRSRPAPPPAS